MKTLHKIFFKRFLKNYSIYFLISYVILVVVFLAPDIFSKDIIVLSYITAFLWPMIYTFFFHLEYADNLDWLINFHYNRKKLIKFFLGTQVFKLFILISTYTINILTVQLIQKIHKTTTKPSETINIYNYLPNTFFELSTLYLVLAIGIYCLFCGSLFKANTEEVRQKQIKGNSNYLNIKKHWKSIGPKKKTFEILAFFGMILLIKNINLFIVYSTIIAGIGAFGIKIFNRRFKLFSLNKENFISASFASIFIFPHLLLFIGATSDVNNTKLSLENRISSAQYVNPIIEISNNQLFSIYNEASECSQIKNISKLGSSNNVAMSMFLHRKLNYCQFGELIYNYRKNPKTDSEKLHFISQIKNYLKKNNFTRDESLNIISYVRDMDVNKIVIREILNTKDEINIFLGLQLAVRNLSYKTYKNLVKDNKRFLTKQLTEVNSIKRALASVNKSKKKDDESNKDKKVIKFSPSKY